LKTLLIIGHTFPEPTTTAAGTRMMQLISLFEKENYIIVFSSTASITEKSETFKYAPVEVKSIALNNTSFDDFIKELNPSVVLFDRFITEEQFGWKVAENCPDSLRILDTEDLHFLRKARQEVLKKKLSISDVNLFSETAKREIASIYRCDLSLIISEFEMELLQNTFHIDASLLYYLPFLVNEITVTEFKEFPTFENRNHFITIGNLLHAPNVDAILFLKKEIWPKIKKQLPKAELHIYGAYAPQQISELHSQKEGFLIKGWVVSVSEVMKNARVCLAPLRFGAGLKGKFLDAMKNGTPAVTTSIGAEGIPGNYSFAGTIVDEAEGIVNASIALYVNKENWLAAQQNGMVILNQRFNHNLYSEKFINQLSLIHDNFQEYRNQNFIGQILQHQSVQATKYMSKWIEEKNKTTNK
jgi:glycosyltransferase involved in cell wall biosynthesis